MAPDNAVINGLLEPDKQRAPAFNQYGNERFTSRLWQSMTDSRQAMQPFLKKRKEVFRIAAGSHYGTEPYSDKQVLNKINQAITVFSRLLASRYPAIRVKADDPDLRATAALWTLDANIAIRECNYKTTLQECVVDAMALFGMTKVVRADDGIPISDGIEIYDTGRPVIDRVSSDHAVLDMSARNWSALQFVGDRSEPDKDWLQRDDRYENTDALPTLADYMGGGGTGSEMVASLSRGGNLNHAALFDRCAVWEVYIPRDNTVFTLADGSGKKLRMHEWEGPPGGPYEMLGFMYLPDNIMPVAPSLAWLNAASILNKVMQKVADQAESRKSCLVGQRGMENDAEIISQAVNGQVILLDNPNGVASQVWGEIDQSALQYAIILMRQLDDLMGGLGVMAGSQAASDTATQDRMLTDNRSIQIDDMRAATVQFTEANARKLAWFNWHDTFYERQVTTRLAGLGLELSETFGPATKKGDWFNYNFEIAPYSMMPKTPQQEIQLIQEFITQILAPLFPLMQQQGKTVSIERLVGLFADNLDVPDLTSLIDDVAAMMPGAPDDMAFKPATTKREYVRHSTSTPSPDAAENAIVQSMNFRGPQNNSNALMGGG